MSDTEEIKKYITEIQKIIKTMEAQSESEETIKEEIEKYLRGKHSERKGVCHKLSPKQKRCLRKEIDAISANHRAIKPTYYRIYKHISLII
ncbi:hypothetical protein [Kushneria phosphatilytica]|uniref:Uncharacterized protein n=1 Tax=Kushneria phosphatilytica TaxID=657387 RepID=A0A1S1NW58_9GAMM|nr:hypothetical protein [Kushneria phosphatilytica]OHV11186.1 hypothetical protein BH688_07625 [Kushneria phosphatilytica]QEL12246.1 hypothetical protein FY550_14610 [Kushneria phosphatilytica]